MEDGEIVKQCSPEDYYQEQNRHIKERLKHSSPINADHSEPSEVIAKITHASHQYKNNFVGCEDVNLEIYKGDFLAVIGLNGSGKSTLAKMLIGLLKSSNGEIKVFDQPVNKKNLTKIRSRTGFLFQNPDYQIFASTLEEEVGFSLKLRSEPKEVIDKKIDECLKFVGLLDYKKMHPQRLSRGQRQLLALASILVSEPDFIIADEPTTGLDENQGYLIMEKLSDLSRAGKTVLVITHDLTMAKYYSNRLVAMHNHRVELDILTRDIDRYLDSFKDIGLNFENAISFKEI
jgi:energy-coupling factor transport system ATP-binding protein